MFISLIDVVGWIGAIFVLLAYAGIASNRLQLHSKIYLLLNLFGSIGILINAYHYRAYPSALLNVAWGAVALYGLFIGLNKHPINHPHHHRRNRARRKS